MKNRTIKFRAWNGEEMKDSFIVGRPQFANALGIMTSEKFAKEKYKLKEWKVMQFTGLKDKNGKDIYEGDILQYKDKDILIVQWGEVSKGVDMGWVLLFPKDNNRICNLSGYETSVVIGNIYENKNLLK